MSTGGNRKMRKAVVLEKPEQQRRVSVDEELGGGDGVMIKSNILRFSSSFSKHLRLKDGDSAVLVRSVLPDGEIEWAVAILPSITDKAGYKVSLAPSGWQIICSDYRKKGLEEGVYLAGATFSMEYKGDTLDCYPLERVKDVR
jgi:hypothetical protein